MNLLQQYREERGVLIAVHRGTNGGNIIQNTTKAYLNAIQHKGDMVEVDVVRSVDGEFFAFHDGQEKLVFDMDIDLRQIPAEQIKALTCFNSLAEPVNQKLETIEEVLLNLEGKCLINIDRSWFYWDTFLEKLKTYKSLNQVLLKAPAKKELLVQLRDSELDVMFMPIIKTIDELELVLNFEGINLVAVELIFKDLESELISFDTMQVLRKKGISCWVNALRLNDTIILSAQIDDEAALFDDGESWIKLVELGFDIIQTDWPNLLYNCLKNKNLKK
ncbi:glycerophosphodiester phosphodiesterase family protein [Streptococcus iners]|uniref:Glycerophosphodiester phosphodiesterase family protein n=1 Tax=Streptococcus iners TaxID=3028084 RepID=A0AA96VN52_9STRE|nr:glycerophosphodiester phosphodiesterase family protein [Streptococcus sp. 29887]MCK4025697.1 glycerophosphodiester phosphodiesterase family protein [Streptococcus suis]WNY52107.1 glycerophosphodiester phosphodiesterase family protein [Streptococcus sp. 29887]